MEKEYFVTHWEPYYPLCVEKKCFVSRCGDCKGGKPDCAEYMCGYRRAECAKENCSKVEKRIIARVSVGRLQNDEIKAFEELTDVRRIKGFILSSEDDLRGKSIVKQVKFRESITAIEPVDERDPRYDYCNFLRYCGKTAHDIRAWRKSDTEAYVKANNPNAITAPIVAAIENLSVALNGVVASSNQSKLLTQEDYPDEKNGFWEPQKKHADRRKLTVGTLVRYREKRRGARISEDGSWGIDKDGYFFKNEGNKPTRYFVPYDGS